MRTLDPLDDYDLDDDEDDGWDPDWDDDDDEAVWCEMCGNYWTACECPDASD